MKKVRMLLGPFRAYNTNNYRTDKKFVKRKPDANPGIENRIRLYKEDDLAARISAGHGFEDLHEDVDEFESDFMNVGKSHKLHEEELEANKTKLKNKITYSKYVKEVEPSFLTFSEKEQIKSLHESDPHQWSVEKLSESFPALPHTIKKVLRAKWTPKSAESVLRYDEKVISNWEAFREGEISVDPEMKRHLENFKDRKIILTDRDELAKRFVPPKIVFPKPKSKFFSNIAETFLLSNTETNTSSCADNTDIKVFKDDDDYDDDVDDEDEDEDAKNVRFKENNNYQNSRDHQNLEITKYFNKNTKTKIDSDMKKSNQNINIRQDFQTTEDFNEDEKEVVKQNVCETNSTPQKRMFESKPAFYSKAIELVHKKEIRNDCQSKKNNNYENLDTMESCNKNEDNNGFRFTKNSYQNFNTMEDLSENRSTEIQIRKNNDYNDRSLTVQNRKPSTVVDDYDNSKIRLTFDEFLKKNVAQTKNSTAPEHIVLKETYKRHLEETSFEPDSATYSSPSEHENQKTDSISEVSRIDNELSSLSLKSQTNQILTPDNKELSLDTNKSDVGTYVKVWHKKGDDIDDPNFITIPKHRFKKGMTYRVRNSYYDDDGEFLYKVPGLHN